MSRQLAVHGCWLLVIAMCGTAAEHDTTLEAARELAARATGGTADGRLVRTEEVNGSTLATFSGTSPEGLAAEYTVDLTSGRLSRVFLLDTPDTKDGATLEHGQLEKAARDAVARLAGPPPKEMTWAIVEETDEYTWLRADYPVDHVLSGARAPGYHVRLHRSTGLVLSCVLPAEVPVGNDVPRIGADKASELALADLGSGASLVGSPRAYQHLGNVLWEVEVRRDETTAVYTVDATTAEITHRSLGEATPRPNAGLAEHTARPDARAAPPSDRTSGGTLQLALAASIVVLAGAVWALLRRRLK
ncbi:MAG: hypothetical protein GF320_10885 [Armatimonadia bacterium]|nr:hypothetical protein [Armatimonadia bacterium]